MEKWWRNPKSHTTPTDFQDGVNADFDVRVNESIPESQPNNLRILSILDYAIAILDYTIANVAMSLMIRNSHHRPHKISNGPPLEQSYRIVHIFQPIFGGTLKNEMIL